MYNHNKAQQSKNRVYISWDILYVRNNPAAVLSSRHASADPVRLKRLNSMRNEN